jgi:hypothetical protein
MDGQDKTEMGRPSLYKPEYAELAHNYCLLGATNEELAGFFDVAPRTVDNWLSEHADFATAVRNGRAAADASIARKLYRRADGYDYVAEKVFFYRGEAKTVDHRVHVPPDVGACIFWLRNRRRQQWSERARPDAADNGLTFDDLEEASRRVAERNANAQ